MHFLLLLILLLPINAFASNPAAPTLPDHVDLTDVKVLKPLLAPEFQTEEHLEAATRIAKSVYQASQRSIGTVVGPQNQFGFAFATNPEVMVPLMQAARGKCIMEIAGARGENAALLALAGAQTVYLNDVDVKEVMGFNILCRTLPANVQSHLESVPFDVFTLLEKKPELRGKLDMVVCRNFLHLLTDQKIPPFFATVRELLKPNGQLILSCHSTTHFIEEFLKLKPNATMARYIKGDLCDHKDGQLTSLKTTFELLSETKEGDDPLKIDNIRPWIIKHVQGTLNVNPDDNEIRRMPGHLQKHVVASFQGEENLKTVQVIQNGFMQVYIGSMRFYSPQALTELLARNGFAVELTRHTSKKTGHCATPNQVKAGQEMFDIVAFARKR
jgi:SAM-dependent methyltransferase